MGFLAKFRKAKRTGKDSSVDSKDVTGKDAAGSNEEEVVTTVSYHSSWNVPQEQQYVFTFLANELAPLKPSQISLSGIEIEAADDKWLVKAFVRSSVDQAIELGEVDLLLLDQDQKKIAEQTFDLKELGALPPNSARPWIFEFNQANIEAEEVPEKDWSLAFDLQSMQPHRLDLAASWEESLPAEQKENLHKIVADLPKLGKSEVNLTGLQIQLQDDGSLAASVFIRNGTKKAVNIEQLPIEIYDANSELVAKGSFKLEDFSVQANTTKPWTFIFPEAFVQKKDADFSRWVARIPQ